MFERFRQAHLLLSAAGVFFPRASDGKRLTSFDWAPIRRSSTIVTMNADHNLPSTLGRAVAELETIISSSGQSFQLPVI
ncbi:hypothetical protein [Acuticoccus sediminis]|uniref:hypothetical protein n=1 Tax=Acuticoccus sediminis TaxID=2184697 RepID=UPI0011B94A63|nr:hypothetical protein [Acuticoccus sediminis]